MAIVATETWTGTDGSAWPGQWTTQLGTAAIADIQGNQGRLQTSVAAYSAGANALLSGMTAIADVEAYVEMAFSDLSEQYAKVMIRASGLPGAPTTEISPDGYYAEVTPSSGGQWTIRRVVGGTQTSLISGQSFNIGANSFIAVRLRAVGAVISMKIWAVGSAEPSTWTWTTTDGSPYTTAGKVFFSMQNGNAAAAKPLRLDNIIVDNTVSTLPIPTNLHTTAVGSTTANLAWNTVSGATSYRLNTTAP